ncbi:MAG TPA: MBL fold metallo-hydrolase, partial [Candidatus Scatomorpha stercoravium]|nr:MBL fold metallo-hydrolase [Candidatus Scatomorpha stercoravium]
SRYSSSFELIDSVKPSVAVVSVGYNSYGHPTEDALARVMTSGAEVYRTDENGSVTIRTDEYGEEGR